MKKQCKICNEIITSEQIEEILKEQNEINSDTGIKAEKWLQHRGLNPDPDSGELFCLKCWKKALQETR